MKNTNLSEHTTNHQAQIIRELLTDGWCDIYAGVQPDSPETPPAADNLLLVTLRFGTFTTPKAGTIHALPITAGVAVNSGTPTWARLSNQDRSIVALDISAGLHDANMVFGEAIDRGRTVTCRSYEHEVAKRSPGV